MNDEKWQNLVGKVKDDLEFLEEGKEDLEESPGFREFIIFRGPLGKMKFERVTRPVVLDKKTIGSRRIGGETAVEYVYSDSEFSQRFQVFKFDVDEGKWLEIDSKDFA